MDPIAAPPAASALGGSSGESSRRVPRKTRSSCDRCHAQKLRCAKEKGELACQRCVKLGTLCRFSPRVARSSLKLRQQPQPVASGESFCDTRLSVCETMTRPATNAYSIINGVDDSSWWLSSIGDPDIAADRAVTCPDLCYPVQGGSTLIQDTFWPGIVNQSRDLTLLDEQNFGNLDLIPISNGSAKSGHNSFGVADACTLPEERESNETLEAYISCTTRELANLSVKVCECAANFPSVDNTTASSGSTAGRGKRESRKSPQFLFDELFQLTGKLLDIIKSLPSVKHTSSPTSFSATADETSSQSSYSLAQSEERHSHEDQPTTRIDTTTPLPTSFPMDEATMYMILSCHCRLAELYTSVFQRMRDCLEHSLIPQVGTSWAVILPRLQGGPVALPPLQVDNTTPIQSKATSHMYMTMVTMISSHLWEQMVDMMREKARAQATYASVSNSSLTSTIWDTVMGRTDEVLQSIDNMKYLLNR